jgi:DNA-nicking Smr family endonuclease
MRLSKYGYELTDDIIIGGRSGRYLSLAKIVLDLHDIFNKGIAIDAELNRVITEAIEKKFALVEIIPGKGSGQLKKHVLRFLAQPGMRSKYHRLEKDDRNFGRIFVHFRH